MAINVDEKVRVPTGTSTGTPPRAGRGGGATNGRRRQVVLYAALTVGVVLFLMPFIIMLTSSLKSQGEILRDPSGLWPAHLTGENYSTWFGKLGISRFFVNSIVVAAFTVLGNIVFCSMVGYALAKMEFRGKKLLFALVMVTLMTPGTVTFVPLFVMVSKLGLVNTYPALVLPFLVTPIGVFLMRQFMLGIPESLLEAARIDGAGEFRIFARIVLPLCGAPVATLAILTFLSSWNNFLWPLVVAQTQDTYTLPIALTLFSKGQDATNYGLLLAGSVLVVAPTVMLFLALQRFFVQSVMSTGVK
jgi:multiple sugar transport system permease protein